MQEREETWVRQAQAGNAHAFGALVTAYQGFVFNLAFRALGDAAEAEDVAQEAFVRAWLALPKFRGQARFRSWLYRIVANLCYNRLPRLRRDLTELGDADVIDWPAELITSPEAEVEGDERRAFLHRQIDALPESYRMLIVLRYQEDLPYEEIATILSLPLGTVKTGLFRARQRLREALLVYAEEV